MEVLQGLAAVHPTQGITLAAIPDQGLFLPVFAIGQFKTSNVVIRSIQPEKQIKVIIAEPTAPKTVFGLKNMFYFMKHNVLQTLKLSKNDAQSAP